MLNIAKCLFFHTKLKVYHNELQKSISNAQNNFAYAYFLPKEWNEKKIKDYFDPQSQLIKRIQVVRDSFDKPTGRAILEMESEEIMKNFIKKYHEDYIDTKDVLQQIAVKPFSLKMEKNKIDIKRSEKQAYITGLPRKMKNEDFLELLMDFGQVTNVQVPKDQNQELNKGYALVLFKKKEDALKFQTFMHGKEFMGKKLGVQLKNFRFDSQKQDFKKENIQDGDIQFEQNKVNYSNLQKMLDVE